MEAWDIALLAGGGYVAVVTLTRMMLRHRHEVMVKLSADVERERREQRAREKANRDERPAEAA